MEGLFLLEEALAAAGNAAIAPTPPPPTGRLARMRGLLGRGVQQLLAPAAGLVGIASLTGRRTAPAFFVIPPDYKPFSVGALGNFPYYWQDPANLRFNPLTYSWITAGLLAGTQSVQLDGVFTNRFINVLSTVVFTLSQADQASLSNAQAAATNEQRNLLAAWQSAFGTLPADAAGTPVINLIMQQVTETWASPPTDLNTLLAAGDPLVLLNTIPPAGKPVVAALAKYLASIAANVPLLNLLTKNNGLLAHALAALQTPSAENGALMLSNGTLMPAVSVQTPVSDILAGLDSENIGRTARISLQVAPDNHGTLDFRLNGKTGSGLPAPQLISLTRPGDGEQLGSVLAAGAAPATITADFTGVTAVSFAPVDFSPATLKSWFWAEPIRQALQNGTTDTTGFKFSPQPPFNLQAGGPFGFVTSVLISRNPSIRVVTAQHEAGLLADAVAQSPGGELSFLGRKLGAFGVEGGYSVTPETAAGGEITLEPAATAASGPTSRAFVLGVKTVFPAG